MLCCCAWWLKIVRRRKQARRALIRGRPAFELPLPRRLRLPSGGRRLALGCRPRAEGRGPFLGGAQARFDVAMRSFRCGPALAASLVCCRANQVAQERLERPIDCVPSSPVRPSQQGLPGARERRARARPGRLLRRGDPPQAEGPCRPCPSLHRRQSVQSVQSALRRLRRGERRAAQEAAGGAQLQAAGRRGGRRGGRRRRGRAARLPPERVAFEGEPRRRGCFRGRVSRRGRGGGRAAQASDQRAGVGCGCCCGGDFGGRGGGRRRRRRGRRRPAQQAAGAAAGIRDGGARSMVQAEASRQRRLLRRRGGVLCGS